MRYIATLRIKLDTTQCSTQTDRNANNVSYLLQVTSLDGSPYGLWVMSSVTGVLLLILSK